MTKEELLKYYREHKNINDEITLIGNFTGCTYRFRHYTAYYTKKDYWLHPINGELYDTSAVISGYEIPDISKQYDKLFNSLKVGDIIYTVTAGDIKSYYKKIDEDIFIECDNAGHIKSCKFIQGFNSEAIIKLSDFVDNSRGV